MAPPSGAKTKLNTYAKALTFPIKRYQKRFHIQWLNGDTVSTIATIQKRDMHNFSTQPVDYQQPVAKVGHAGCDTRSS